MKTSKPRFHTRYDPPPSPGIVFTEPSKTQQHFRDECDINKVVQRALHTGDMTIFTTQQRGEFYDASVVSDYSDAMAMINDVHDDFKSLPSEIRAQFGNDVSKYVAWMSDPANWEAAVELGLLETAEPSKGSPSEESVVPPREREKAPPSNTPEPPPNKDSTGADT